MPDPVYHDFLTRASASRLGKLVQDLPHPVALAGGHAVRLRVESEWRRAFREEYFGSRDIDLCYYVQPDWSLQELRESAVGRAPGRIRDLGYRPIGSFRFGVTLDAHGNVLEQEPGPPAIRMVDFDTLFLDPMVTNMHPRLHEVIGFRPVDEPILRLAFESPALRTPLPGLGENVFLPSASLLVATKLKSLPERQKDDKAIKDVCDLYALATHGGEPMRAIRALVHEVLPDVRDLVRQATSHDLLPRAAEHLGLSPRDLRAVIQPLALRP